MKRIEKLSDSCCFNCPVEKECEVLLEKNMNFHDIKTMVFGKKEYNRESCPLYIGLTCEVR